MHCDHYIKVKIPISNWLRTREHVIKGIFLIHMQLDELLGLPIIPSEVPVFIGPSKMGIILVFSRLCYEVIIPRNTAYLASTWNGLVLTMGDTAHTAISSQLDVPPGTFACDLKKAETSFYKIKTFVERYPGISLI